MANSGEWEAEPRFIACVKASPHLNQQISTRNPCCFDSKYAEQATKRRECEVAVVSIFIITQGWQQQKCELCTRNIYTHTNYTTEALRWLHAIISEISPLSQKRTPLSPEGCRAGAQNAQEELAEENEFKPRQSPGDW